MQHEAFFRFAVPPRKDGSTEEDYLCSFNQRAMRTVTQVTGREPVPYLVDQAGGVERTQILAYACTESFRRGNGYVVSFDDFIDGPYLGVMGSPYWASLAAFIEELVLQTFPWVAELRSLIRRVPGSATDNESNGPNPSESLSTGTDVSTLPGKPKSSRRKRNSGTAGT